MISYNRLWETMEKRKISQYRLIQEFKATSQMSKSEERILYRFDAYVGALCRILDCRIEDVMEVSFEDEEKENKAN
ncbi:MAG: helix-turn-helix domain-containing protein [Clostridiaceae bacterium]